MRKYKINWKYIIIIKRRHVKSAGVGGKDGVRKKELGKGRMEGEEMERQRWRESERETSAVQLSLFTLNP